jgi:hypothetical protein
MAPTKPLAPSMFVTRHTPTWTLWYLPSASRWWTHSSWIGPSVVTLHTTMSPAADEVEDAQHAGGANSGLVLSAEEGCVAFGLEYQEGKVQAHGLGVRVCPEIVKR